MRERLSMDLRALSGMWRARCRSGVDAADFTASDQHLAASQSRGLYA